MGRQAPIVAGPPDMDGSPGGVARRDSRDPNEPSAPPPRARAMRCSDPHGGAVAPWCLAVPRAPAEVAAMPWVVVAHGPRGGGARARAARGQTATFCGRLAAGLGPRDGAGVPGNLGEVPRRTSWASPQPRCMEDAIRQCSRGHRPAARSARPGAGAAHAPRVRLRGARAARGVLRPTGMRTRPVVPRVLRRGHVVVVVSV